MPVKAISEAEFEQEVIRNERPVLVDFFATWSEPCKQVAPEIEAIALELEGKADVVRVDIEKSPRIAQMLRIQSVPTFVVFAQGRPVAAERGVVKRARFRELLEPFLPRAEGAIKPAELAEALKQPGIVAVDIRDTQSFARAHIPGASNLPSEEITSRLAELHMLGQPVLYCRAGNVAKELSEKLAADGMPIPFLEGGFLGWEADSLPIERS